MQTPLKTRCCKLEVADKQRLDKHVSLQQRAKFYGDNNTRETP